MEPARRLELVRVKLDQRIGTELGGYRILEQLGRGGTSVVYRAEHVRLGRQAALKLLSPGLGDADFSDRFLRESRLAASLDHPNIVPVYDAGEEEGLLYIAMAYVEGTDLKTLVTEEGPLPLGRALGIAGQVASALDAAHDRGLVHRDVKPANILVGPDDRAYLSDFGAVKELASGGMTRTGSFVGTIEYCAPEQIEGGAVDARTDVYALGCVLWECLTGTPPFHRQTEVAVLNAHLHADPPKLARVAPELPSGLEPVLTRALAKQPLDRYGSCGAFVAAARGVAAERRVDRRRLALSLAMLALAALVGAAIALGVQALGPGSSSTATPTSPPARPTYSLDKLVLRSDDGRTLNDMAYALIGAHQYRRALPFAQKAVRKAPIGSLTYAFATYNLGYARLQLNQCSRALLLLRRALKLEPADLKPLVRRRITHAQQRCSQAGASARAQSP
jgi:serine/threonine protein kinase